MARKFFRTILKVIVLTEDAPIGKGVYVDHTDLKVIADMIDDGPAVGDVTIEKTEELTGKQMAKALKKAASDPSFFRMDDKGEDSD